MGVAAALAVLSAGLVGAQLAGSSTVPQELPLERLLQRVQERHRTMKDLRARFRQRQIQRVGAVPIVREGWWLVRTPGRLRIEYDDPPNVFVADGERMYWYLAEDHQVQVFSPDSMDPAHVPTLYLSGQGDLLQDFDISGTRWETLLGPGNIQIRLQPRSLDTRFTHLVLEVEPDTATVVRLVWFGLLGEANDYQFFDIETDVGLADELFQFTIPSGAEVEYLGG